MRLEIKGDGILTDSFSSIWGYYVSGFDYRQHCQACLKGKLETRIQRGMSMDDVILRDDMPYFYLCALGRPRSGEANVHMAVRPKPNAVASTGSLFGFTFTIRDATAIRIRTLRKGWRGLDNAYTQCPNFQFGVQAFGYPVPDGALDFGESLLAAKVPEAGEV